MTEEPETWLGNVRQAVKAALRSAKSAQAAVSALTDSRCYCLRCGLPHAGECLRGDR